MSWKNPFLYTEKEKALSDAYIRKTGSIRHILAPHQQKFYDLYHRNSESALYCSRKTGKSFTTLLIATELCLQKPGVIVRYAMLTLKLAKEILLPIFEELRKIIPSDCFPHITVYDMSVTFKNGSQIKICGSNREAAETSRGPRANLIICDEVTAWDAFAEYMITSILMPQGTLVKNFKIIYAGTPPTNMDTYFIQKIYPKLLSLGSIISIDIDQNPLLDQKSIERIISMYPKGREDPNFRREHKLELIPANNLRLTPEFDPVAHTFEDHDKCVDYGNQKIPQTYQYFMSVDTATVDNTAILIGFLDHHSQQLIIEEEFVKNNINLTEIATEINRIKEKYQPFFYHCDNGIKTVIDAFSLEHKEFREIHGIQHTNPIKGKVEDNIAHLRSAFENNKLLISKKCTRLIWELNNCVWEMTVGDNKKIERNSDQKHGDAVMALTYMLRAVNWRFRPGQKEHNISLTDYNPKKNSVEKLKQTPRIWGNLRSVNG